MTCLIFAEVCLETFTCEQCYGIKRMQNSFQIKSKRQRNSENEIKIISK